MMPCTTALALVASTTVFKTLVIQIIQFNIAIYESHLHDVN